MDSPSWTGFIGCASSIASRCVGRFVDFVLKLFQSGDNVVEARVFGIDEQVSSPGRSVRPLPSAPSGLPHAFDLAQPQAALWAAPGVRRRSARHAAGAGLRQVELQGKRGPLEFELLDTTAGGIAKVTFGLRQPVRLFHQPRLQPHNVAPRLVELAASPAMDASPCFGLVQCLPQALRFGAAEIFGRSAGDGVCLSRRSSSWVRANRSASCWTRQRLARQAASKRPGCACAAQAARLALERVTLLIEFIAPLEIALHCSQRIELPIHESIQLAAWLPAIRPSAGEPALPAARV